MKAIKFGLMALLMLLQAVPLLAQSSDDEEAVPVVSVRKRYFSKAKRMELNANAAWVGNDSFVRSLVPGGSLGYHFSESFYLEGTGGYFINYDTSNTDFLQEELGITPDTDDIEYYGSLHAGWCPIYGKLNFLGKKIVYFDTSFYAGLGVTNAAVSSLSPHIAVGVTQHFALSKSFALRFDLKDNIVIRDDAGVDGTIRHVVFLSAGISFFFPTR